MTPSELIKLLRPYDGFDAEVDIRFDSKVCTEPVVSVYVEDNKNYTDPKDREPGCTCSCCSAPKHIVVLDMDSED